MKKGKQEVMGWTPLKELSEREIESPREIIRDGKWRIVVPVPQDTNKNGKAWRPTDYRPEYAQQLIDFMSRTSHEVWINKTYYKAWDWSRDWWVKSEKHVVIAETYPTLQRFAFNIWVLVETLNNWADAKYSIDYPWIDDDGNPLAWTRKHPEFFDSLRIAKQIQEAILVENGLNGNYSSQFAVFIAKNNFGYSDKTELDVSDKTPPRKTALDKFTSLISWNNDQDDWSRI